MFPAARPSPGFQDATHPLRPADTFPTERAALVQRVHQAATTAGSKLLIFGEPGIGKTALLESAAAHARAEGSTVLHIRASDPVASQPFHGVVDLLSSLDQARIERLPPIQRLAVEVALGRRTTSRDLSPLTLHVAVRTLLDALLTEQTVLIVVDDWPWLDAESAAVLQHLLERSTADERNPSLIASQRVKQALSGEPDTIDASVFEPTDVVEVPALSNDGLRSVLQARTGKDVPPATLAALHHASGGNPLWAMELLTDPRPLSPEQDADEARLPRSIAEAVRGRIEALPEPVLDVLAAVAAAGSAAPTSLNAFAAGGRPAVAAALQHHVVHVVEGRFRCSHPVLGSAALEHLGAWKRLQLHRRLAMVSPTTTGRAHHLDLAALPGPDEATAAALAAAAVEHRAHGALTAALHSAERAVLRTARDAEARPVRVVTLAEIAFAAGHLDRVVEVLVTQELAALSLTEFDRAVPLLMDALTVSARGERAVIEQLEILNRLVGVDSIRRAVLEVYRGEVESRPASQRRTSAEQAITILTHEPRTPVAQHRALGVLVLARLDAGEGLDERLLIQSEVLEQHLALVAPNDSAQAQRGFHSYEVDDLSTSEAALQDLLEQMASRGEESIATVFGVHLALVHLLSGRPATAADLLLDATRTAPWANNPPPAVVRVLGLLALTQGDSEEVHRLAQLPITSGAEGPAQIVRAALPGLLAARREDWALAVEPLLHARSTADYLGVREPGRRLWLDVELGESLVALDRLNEAAEVADWLGEVAAHGRRPLAGGQELRLRGLLAAAARDLEEAEGLLVSSVTVLATAGYPLEHARSLLELGRVLRRRRAHTRARATFEGAQKIAAQVADVPLQARLERELHNPSTGRGGQLLTAAELLAARAAARGASNREIAAAQFVSIRTVEAHLSRVFHKLGIRSRTQLASRLNELDVDTGLLPAARLKDA